MKYRLINMNFKYFILYSTLFLFTACKQNISITKIEGKRLEINDSISGVKEIEDFIKPFREHITNDLDSVLAYSVGNYSKNDGSLNTAIGNLMADAMLELSTPIYRKRTGNNIDMAISNYGGIRAILPKGNVTARTAYELMPFENETVVVELKGKYVKELVTYLQRSKQAHPISGLQIILDKDYKLLQATINGKPIDDNKIYHIVTHDYLYYGGGKMTFFENSDSHHFLDYKVRNLLIDYFKKHDTLNPVIDNRFIQTK
jgi:2',3'-cyclic-nucleotide 2'-phosphodiesterase (5'-nucleotidase family)